MIQKEHIDFAKELVVLARKHGVNHITIEFDLNSCKNFLIPEVKDYKYGKVKVTWYEGRHGSDNKINFESTDTVTIEE